MPVPLQFKASFKSNHFQASRFCYCHPVFLCRPLLRMKKPLDCAENSRVPCPMPSDCFRIQNKHRSIHALMFNQSDRGSLHRCQMIVGLMLNFPFEGRSPLRRQLLSKHLSHRDFTRTHRIFSKFGYHPSPLPSCGSKLCGFSTKPFLKVLHHPTSLASTPLASTPLASTSLACQLQTTKLRQSTHVLTRTVSIE